MTSKILHFVNLDTIGGVEELFIHFLLSQERSLHHLWVTSDGIHPYFEKMIGNNRPTCDFEKFVLGCKVPKFLRTWKRSQILKKSFTSIILWNRFDEIETHAPTIYYEHGASWMEPQTKKFGSFFEGIDAILANSNAAKRLLELKWGVKKDITVIENPLRPDLAIVERSRENFRTPFRIGCIGRLIPHKGICLAIETVRKLCHRGIACELFIAGAGPEKEALQKAAYGLPVHFRGVVRNVEVFYDSIDLLLVPSIREPLGLVALEAEARACPVCAASVDGLAESCVGPKIAPTLPLSKIGDFGGNIARMPDCVYDPLCDILSECKLLDPELIADTIQTIIETPGLYRKLSNEALAFIRGRENFNSYREKLLTFIKSTGRSKF
jgi:glycosyltransferase involved in cell wall biosynthesis